MHHGEREGIETMLRVYDEFIENLVCAIYLSLITTGFLQVFSRYVLNYSLPWTEEIGRYSFVYLTFIGAALCVRNEMNINLDLLIKRFPESMNSILQMGVDLSILVFLALLLYQGSLITLKTVRQVSAALHLPMALFYLSIPLGALFMLINTVRLFFKHARQYHQLQSEE